MTDLKDVAETLRKLGVTLHPPECLCPRCDPDDVKLHRQLRRADRADDPDTRMDRFG